LADKDRQAGTAPPSAVSDLEEDIMSRIFGRQDPEWNDNSQEAQEVAVKGQSLKHWQRSSPESIERHRQKAECNHE
jgi:hypothetical protein